MEYRIVQHGTNYFSVQGCPDTRHRPWEELVARTTMREAVDFLLN